MQALRVERSSRADTPTVKIDTVPIPQASGEHVVVKIKAAAIQPSDRLNARGGFSNTSFPITPGRDFAGVVVDGPTELVNQEVFGTGGNALGFTVDGSHAEYCLMHKDFLAVKPRTMSFIEAAAVGVPFTTALLCLRRARTTAQDSVLVIGSTGAVGSAAVLVARGLGCEKVYGAARRATADVDLGADPSFRTLDQLTKGRGVDVIVDTVGNLELMTAAADHLARRGRYTWISAPRGVSAPTVFAIDLLATYRDEHEFIGCNSGTQTPAEIRADLQVLSGFFANGTIQPREEKSLEQTTLSGAINTYQSAKTLQVIVLEP